MKFYDEKCESTLEVFSDLDVSNNRGTSKSSIFIGFSIIHHPFWGTPIFGNTYLLGQGGWNQFPNIFPQMLGKTR